MEDEEVIGFDDLAWQLKDARRAAESVDGDLAKLRFNPNDPGDVERAIRDAEWMVDQKLRRYRSNPFIEKMIPETKKECREQIIKLAASSRQSAGHKDRK
jgi:hypothetical protein